MKRALEDALQTRAHLLDAAMKVFLARGYPDARVEDIAEAAEVTRGAFYHHFPGKKEIYYALIEERCRPAMAMTEKYMAAETASPLSHLEEFITGYLGLLARDAKFREANELMILKTAFVPELADGMKTKVAGIRSIMDWLGRRIEAAQKNGEARRDMDARTAAFVMYGALNGMVSLWLMDRSIYPLGRSSSQAARTIVNTVR